MPCPLCRSSAQEGIPLSNGNIVHSHCFRNLTETILALEKRLSDEHLYVAGLRDALSVAESIVGRISRFFGAGHDPDDLRAKIAKSQSKIEGFVRDCVAVRSLATPIFDVLSEYPPDWGERSKAVERRDQKCTVCGSRKVLQAHHIVPLSRGGTNRLTNLQLLCSRCHEGKHGGQPFGEAKRTSPTRFSENVLAVKKAMDRNSDIEFLYKKPRDRKSMTRRITPQALVEVEHIHDEENTLCVRGYCHLRKATRTFAIKRITNLKCL